jgi:hypothetical protein
MWGGEKFEIQDLRTSSHRLAECEQNTVTWKLEITNQSVVNFQSLFRNPSLQNTCLQYVSCVDDKKKLRVSQILECGLTSDGICESLSTCLEKRSDPARSFYLAEIQPKAGPTSYSSPDSTSCHQAGNPEALHSGTEAICLQKMDCAKPGSEKHRYVLACPVTGQKFGGDRPEDGTRHECPALLECAQKQIPLQPYVSKIVSVRPPKTVNTAAVAKVKTTKKTASKSTKRKPASKPQTKKRRK